MLVHFCIFYITSNNYRNAFTFERQTAILVENKKKSKIDPRGPKGHPCAPNTVNLYMVRCFNNVLRNNFLPNSFQGVPFGQNPGVLI